MSWRNKRPTHIVRFDTLRLAVKEDGSLDQDHYRRCLTDIFSAIDAEDSAGAATARKYRSPNLSEVAYKRVLTHLRIHEPVVLAAAA